MPKLIRFIAVLVFGSMPAWAAAQNWELNEVYSNADRTVQFVVHSTRDSGQQHLGGLTLVAVGEGTTHTFTFPHDLPCDSAGHSLLIATQGFAELNLVKPDYVVPNAFFPTWVGVIWIDDEGYEYSQVPADGTRAFWLDPDFFAWIDTAVATNFAGQRYAFGPYTWPPPPLPPQSATSLTTSANPGNGGQTVTLTATVTAATPTGTVAFTEADKALPGCDAVAVSGATAVCTAAVTIGAHSLVGTYSGNDSICGSISPPLLQKVNPVGMTNVALASAGATTTASSAYQSAGYDFDVGHVNDGERAGAHWSHGGGWNDAINGVFPDSVEINFGAAKTIDRVIVYTVQDNYGNPIEPTDTLTFTQNGVTDFSIDAWNGAAWVTQGTVSGNTLVKRKVRFAAPVTTSKIRINITGALGGYSRLTEVEAYGVNAGSNNFALAINGGVASASSTFTLDGLDFGIARINDGEPAGLNWMFGGGWNDATAGAFPDWVEIDFSGTKTIDRVVVYTVQDNYANPTPPTDAMTFAKYGVTDFDVQGWDGANWVTLGNVSGNNLVKRTVNFSGYATNKVRVNVTGALASYSRITEIEAWGN